MYFSGIFQFIAIPRPPPGRASALLRKVIVFKKMIFDSVLRH
jgi:hypothetical protein